MKNSPIYFCILFLISGFISDTKYDDPYTQGEILEYRVHYGLLNAGEAKIEVDPKLYLVNGKVCYKALVKGNCSGPFDFMLKIRDIWGSYVDTASLVPQRTFRNIEEGKYRLKENVNFDFVKGVAVAERHMKDKKDVKEYPVPTNVQDMVSGYFYLRNINYDRLHHGDTIGVNAFFEDKLYDFRVKYLGRSTLKTKFGNIRAIKLSPVMPDNQLFEGGNSIRVWLSDDRNKIPVKIEADMYVGAVEMDLKGYTGLRYPICFKK
jgi:hypothetical protein